MTITLTMKCPTCGAEEYLGLKGTDVGRADLHCMRCGNIAHDFFTPEMDDGDPRVGLRIVNSVRHSTFENVPWTPPGEAI